MAAHDPRPPARRPPKQGPPRAPARGEGSYIARPLGGAGAAAAYIGLDDTDSLKGGCTTHAAFQLALELRRRLGLALLEHPRLVRLNPNNPWKTRGNAALALRVGRPSGEPKAIGAWRGSRIEMYPRGEDVPPSAEALDLAWSVVGALTWPEGDRTNPGIVVMERPGPADWYREALHTILDIPPVEARLRAAGALLRGAGSRRGIIGASAAIAWPLEPHTWELLAYRAKSRWGTAREVDPASVLEMQRAFPSTYDSYDEENEEATMVPSSPCPILFGIRGTEARELPRALSKVRSEPAEGWAIYRTNQGTDDHLMPKPLGEARAHESVTVAGAVAVRPRTIRGGHVLLSLEEGGARLDAAAYEPTKRFRDAVRALRPGDRVVACGSVRDSPLTVNLEKLRVLSLGSPTERVKVGNPRCPGCGKAMKSAGKGAGFRCAACHTRATARAGRYTERPRAVAPGWYEVPTDARRHLARPLRLGVRPDLEEWAVGQA